MQSIRLLPLAATIIIAAGAFAATPIPEAAERAVVEWQPAFTRGQRDEIAKRLQLDQTSLRDISYHGEDLQGAGKNADALHYFEFCFAFGQDLQDDLRTSVCEQLMAGSERLQGRYEDAEKHYRGALIWAQKPGVTHRVPIILSNLAGVYVAQSRYAEALEMLDQVDEINRRNGVTDDAPPVQNRAIIYGLQGDLARSLEQFLKALHMYEKAGDERKIALAHYNIGVLQIKQANYEAAARELETALASQQKTGDRNRAAQALSDLGRVRDLQGRPKEALELMTRAAALNKEINYKVGYGEALINLGDFHQSHQAWDEARKNFEEAFAVLEPLKDGNDLGLALRGLGLVALGQGRISEAARNASAAIETARSIGDMQGEWQAEALAGMAARTSGDIETARNSFTRAVDLIELQRGMVAGAEVEKQRFFEQAAYPYQELALLNSSENGFAGLRAAERAKARLLLDLVESGPDHLERFFSAEESAQENRFRASISGLNTRISTAGANVAALVRERDALWQSYQTFQAGVYVRNPELRAWRGAAPPLTEGDVAGIVSQPDTAVVEFLCAREETLVFLVSRGADASHPSVRAARIAVGREDLRKPVARLHQMLDSRDPGYRKEARALYRLLLGSLDSRTLHQKKRIWIIADGPLWDVPFQALIDSAGHYWIQDASIAFAPSLTFLRERQRELGKPLAFSKDLVAFADPVRADAPPVPALRDQVRQISALYDPGRTDVKMGSAAQEKAFREVAPTARVLHVAAHGMVDQNNAMHSRILLSGTGADDGWIEAWELIHMGIKADLAVLSACETGRGQASDGEGLVGLTWALFVSGVRNAVVSQWRVESESASALMVGLHKRVRNGQRPSEALRQSVLELMKDERYQHPTYWAAFVSVGIDTPLGK